MDEQSTSQEKSNMSKAILVIVGVVIVGLLGYLLYSNSNKVEAPTEDMAMVDEVKDDQMEVEETTLRTMLIDEMTGSVAVFEEYAVLFKPLLTEQGQENLDLVVVYVRDNPEVLDDPSLVPQDILDAADEFLTEIENAVTLGAGVIINEHMTKELGMGDENNEEMMEEDSMMERVPSGTVATIQGVISQAPNNPFGVTYEVVDENGKYYYFILSPQASADVEANMLGQTVSIDVEITYASDGAVLYNVIAGPTLVQDQS